MKIQFNTDKNTKGTEEMSEHFIAQVERDLNRFKDHISRVEIHLSDEDGHKDGPNAKRCLLEARIEGRQPIAVSDHSDSYNQAMNGALEKLVSSLDTIMGKLSNHP
jgi:ribosome-associated translation inhibitor RaiA